MERTLLGHPARFAAGLHEIAPATFAWMQPNGGWGESNGGLVAGADSAVLIDTLWDIRLTARMLAAIRERVTVPIETVVNTHSDGDHVWGNQLLAEAGFVATSAAARLIREESPEQIARFKALARVLRRLASLPLPVVGRLELPLLPRLPTRDLGDYVGAMLAPYDFSGIVVTPPAQEFDHKLTLTATGRDLHLARPRPGSRRSNGSSPSMSTSWSPGTVRSAGAQKSSSCAITSCGSRPPPARGWRRASRWRTSLASCCTAASIATRPGPNGTRRSGS